MSTATSMSPPIKNGVRIISYNLLSSKLARPSHFTHAEPEHLEFDYRLRIILAKLDEEMNRGFGGNEDSQQWIPPSIFALQEVCYPFASALHTFFAQRGYHFVTGLYGKQFNGYMGVGIAYPLKDFATVNVDICRLSDERVGGWPREKSDEEEGSGERRGLGNVIQRVTAQFGLFAFQTLQTMNNFIVKRLGYNNPEKAVDPWEMSENRYNVLLTVTLCHREGGRTFSISNYHMPCAFFAPAVMNIHTEMVSKRVQDLAAESWKSIRSDECPTEPQEGIKSIPYILAGDFNILPDSAQYKILTSGQLDSSDPTYPPTKHGKEWKIESLPMDSAYALGGSEPEFTNYAHTRDEPDPFIGTLDYIFLSKNDSAGSNHGENKGWGGWKVHCTQKLPRKEDSGGPLPNAKEPSDHLLIAADLELVSL